LPAVAHRGWCASSPAGERRLAKREATKLGFEFLILPPVTTEAAELAAILIDRVPLPTQAAADAAHMAVAAYHGIDFLLTWNVAHIANATLRRKVDDVCRDHGYSAPVLCTPDELMEGTDE
jgi:hypothetical protein